MSSVLRFLKQKPSNTMIAYTGAEGYSYAALNTQLIALSGAEWLATSVGQFATQANLLTAIGAVVSAGATYSYGAGTTLLDMGERVYWGVEGSDSEQVVFALVMDPKPTLNSTPYYVCVKNITTATLPVDVVRGAF